MSQQSAGGFGKLDQVHMKTGDEAVLMPASSPNASQSGFIKVSTLKTARNVQYSYVKLCEIPLVNYGAIYKFLVCPEDSVKAVIKTAFIYTTTTLG